MTNVDGRFHAAQGVCSHEYFELDRGVVIGDSILCTLHLSRFSLIDGEVFDPPVGTRADEGLLNPRPADL